MNDSKTKRKYTFGVLIGGVHTYFPQKLMSGIRRASKDLDVNVYFFLGTHTRYFFKNMLMGDTGNLYDYQFNTIYDYSLLGGLDGMIINYGTLGIYLENNDLTAFASKYNSIPTVILTEKADLPNCHYLISDNYSGISAIMKHLIEDHGYKKILHVSGPEGNTDAMERKQAYIDAMHRYHLPFEPSMIETGDYSEFADQQVNRLLDAYPDAQAIVFGNDEMASSAYRVCAERGLKIGRDIAITGYDDCEISSTLNPPLTTVEQDGYALGYQAVADLLERMAGKKVSSRHLPVKMICRESCGCSNRGDTQAETRLSLYEQRQKLNEEISVLHQDFVDFQRKSWFIPFFARDLNNYVKDEEQFCRQIIVNLKKVYYGNMFLFLLDQPLTYEQGEEWRAPGELRLASYYRNHEIVSYYPYDRPVVSAEHPITEYMYDTEKSHHYTFLLLFSNEKQYGLLASDISQTDFPFFYMMSLQLGLSLRYLESSQMEASHLLELSKTMDNIREQNRLLDLMSAYDELTGLLNLRGFREQAKSVCAARQEKRAYMIYADLDHLKEINDTFSHIEGNFAIRTAGKLLKNCIRDTDILARVGGDEFLILVTSETETFEQLFRIRVEEACREFNIKSDKPFYVELTLGIQAFLCSPDIDLQEIISQADASLYEYKKFRKASVRKDRIS